MTLNTREKYIAIGAGGAVAVFILYTAVVGPFLTRRQEIAAGRAEVEKNLDLADVIFHKDKTLRKTWADMKSTGGLTADVPDALNQIEEAVHDWAQTSGVNVISVTPSQGTISGDQRSEKPEAKFQRLEVSVTGFGSMAQITKLMWKLESAPKLLKVLDMKITPRREATDDLQVTVKIGTVSLAEAPPRPNAREGNMQTNDTEGAQQ